MKNRLSLFITFTNYKNDTYFPRKSLVFCLNNEAKNMLIFFAFFFLYKNHCQSSMYVKFEFLIVTNHTHCHFYVHIYYILSNYANLIATNKVFVSLNCMQKI